MASLIGRTFIHHGLNGATQTAAVIAQTEPKGRKGRVLVTVRLEDGTEYKTDAKSIPDGIALAPPATGPMFTGHDQYRYDRNGRIFCKGD